LTAYVVRRKKNLGVVCGPSQPSAAPWILQDSTVLLKSLFSGPRHTDLWRNLKIFSVPALAKKAVRHHSTAKFSAVLIRQWPV